MENTVLRLYYGAMIHVPSVDHNVMNNVVCMSRAKLASWCSSRTHHRTHYQKHKSGAGMTDTQQPFHGGSISCNPGQRHTVKLSVARAAYENVSNALNATSDTPKGIGVIEVFPRYVHPLSMDSESADANCFAVVSNSYLDPANYREAINYGRTRGTEQGNDKQAVGNDQGIGMKESCFSMGGNPGFISIKKIQRSGLGSASFYENIGKGKYTLSGLIVHDALMDLRVQMGLSSQKELSYVTFKVNLIVMENGTCKSELVYPKLNKENEYYDKVGLFCTGLPFCADGTHYSLKANGYLESDESYVENKWRFLKACESILLKTLSWSRDKLQALKRQNTSRLYHDIDQVEDALDQEMSIAFCHSMPVPIFFAAKDDNPYGMTEHFNGVKQCHKWCTKGSSLPLSTSLALQINWPYYDARAKSAVVFVEGVDIRSANVYIPLVRASEYIAQRKASYNGPYSDFTIENNGTTYGTVSFCNVVNSNTNIGAMLRNVDRDMDGMPRVEWDDDDTPRQTWDSWNMASTREPPPGVFITRGSGVINPMGATDYWFNSGKYIGGQERAAEKLRKCMEFALYSLDSARYGQCIAGFIVIRFLCNALDIKIGEYKADRKIEYYNTTFLEKELATKIKKLLSIDRHFNPETRSEVVYTEPWIEAMTITKAMNDKVNFFPTSKVSESCKYVIQRMFGASSCGIYNVNADVFSVNQEKTCITPVQGLLYNKIVTSIFAASSVYSLSYECPDEQEYRMRYIDNNHSLFERTFVANRVEHRTHKSTRVQCNPSTVVVDRSDMPIKEWIDFVRGRIEQEEDRNTASSFVYDKNANGKGWKIDVSFRPHGGTQAYDMYYKHYTYGKMFSFGGKLRSEKAVEWFEDFLSRNLKIDGNNDILMCKKNFNGPEFKRICREQGIETCLRPNNTSNAIEYEASSTTVAIGEGASPEEISATARLQSQHEATSARKQAKSPSNRKAIKIYETPCEVMVRTWFCEHPYDDPMFVYSNNINADEERIRKMVAILGRIADKRDSTDNFLNYDDVVCILSNFMCDTTSGLGKRRLNQAKATTGAAKKLRTIDLATSPNPTNPPNPPTKRDVASSSSGVTEEDLINGEAETYLIEELD